MLKTKGRLKNFLETQMTGLTGNIERAGFPFDTVEWGKPDYLGEDGNPRWEVYEQTAYWLDGFTRCTILLGDQKAIARASEIIYSVINNPHNGYLGPVSLKNLTDGFARWPHVVFFRACIALFEYNNDIRIIEAIKTHYLTDDRDYSLHRNVNNVEIMCYVYEITKDREILDKAIKCYEEYNKNCRNDLCDRVALSDKKPYAHGVSYNEYSKLGAILYRYTGKKEYLVASVSAYKKIDKYFMLIDGLHCSNEFLISDGVMQSHETCCISDYTWSLYHMYKATKNTEYLDAIERCVFNAGLGSVTEDFRALQYFSCVNQAIADGSSNHNVFYKGSSWMAYSPNPGTECCPGNVNRFMPNYVSNMWAENGDEISLNLYGDSVFTNEYAIIDEKTDYPFVPKVILNVKAKKLFRLKFRVPRWAEKVTLMIDGKECVKNKGNDYFIDLEIENDCEIAVEFECGVKVKSKRNYIWFERGCVVYAMPIKTKIKKNFCGGRFSDDFPAYEMYPDGKWNYGVKKDVKPVFDEKNNTISVKCYEIQNFALKHAVKVKRCFDLYSKRYTTAEGNFTFTSSIPQKPILTGKKENITLMPYGFAKLRITAFPIIRKSQIGDENH